MTFRGILFICTVICTFNLVTSIKCFNCAVTGEIFINEYERIFTPSCLNFDASPTFIIDCPYSTMCSRIISTMYIRNAYEQKTITLGCAQQKLLRHVLYKGKWKEEYSVQEIYSEGCKTMSNNNLVGATKTYCYCRGDLCNSAHSKYVVSDVYTFWISFVIIIKAF